MRRDIENLQSYGGRMYIARINAGMTVPQLAEASGVSEPMIYKIEAGGSYPTIITAEKLASALGLTVDEYINGVVPRKGEKYKLERLIDGHWYGWGTYDDPVRLAHAAHELGGYGFKVIRVEVVT